MKHRRMTTWPRLKHLWVVAMTLPAWGSPTTPHPLPWSFHPVSRPAVPQSAGIRHPIDAFLAVRSEKAEVEPLPAADRSTLLRRLSLDLTGLPPTPEETVEFLADTAPDAYGRAVDRLLASPRHGERFAQHWLDVLRYADVDGSMPAEPGIHHWRSWIIDALNKDLPYNEFVGRQLAGDLSGEPHDLFATGFLARGATRASGQGMSFSAVETVASAFLGVTLACARCHDHFHDPISQREYYETKALFDPLVLEKTDLSTAKQKTAHKTTLETWNQSLAELQARMDEITSPYYPALFEERLKHLPEHVAAIYRKPAEERTKEEQGLADDYSPVVRIDPRKYRDVMKPDEIARYNAIRTQHTELKRDPPTLPVFYAVRRDEKKARQPTHILEQGDPGKRGEEVSPGFPLARRLGVETRPAGKDRNALIAWLSSPDHPLFARVVVNRIWGWHFGEGLVSTPSDFGNLSAPPHHPELLDWLATEFVRVGYSMKALHRLIVTSQAYRRASTGPLEQLTANAARDPGNVNLWRFPLRRLEAEAIRDSVLFVAGDLDLAIGGQSFRAVQAIRRGTSKRKLGNYDDRSHRRTLYMGRGYHVSVEMMPSFLDTFNATDGRTHCARREQTVTAPQALYLLNSELSQSATQALSQRLIRETGGTRDEIIKRGYLLALGRTPTRVERTESLRLLTGSRPDLAGPQGGPTRSDVEAFAWLLINLAEFSYIR